MAAQKDKRAPEDDPPAHRTDNGEKPAAQDDPEFERFEDLTRQLLKVSKRELDQKRNGG